MLSGSTVPQNRILDDTRFIAAQRLLPCCGFLCICNDFLREIACITEFLSVLKVACIVEILSAFRYMGLQRKDLKFYTEILVFWLQHDATLDSLRPLILSGSEGTSRLELELSE